VLGIVRELSDLPATSLEIDTPLMEAGVDSLAATEFASRHVRGSVAGRSARRPRAYEGSRAVGSRARHDGTIVGLELL
jgi:hypothetical protein